MSESRTIRCRVEGEVQGVGFRAFVRDEAERLGLRGWVRNEAGGRAVELVAQGSGQGLTLLRAALDVGPPASRVERVRCEEIDDKELSEGFSIRREQ